MSSAPPHRLLAAALAAGLALSGCSDPEVTAPSPESSAPSEAGADALPAPGPAASIPDPRQRALLTEAEALLATLVDANAAFDVLARATSRAEARPTTTRLLAVLSADPAFRDPDGDGVEEETGVRPLLPGPSTSREETIDYGDVFSGLLTAGRDAGPAGAPFVDVLRDPIVGDLGSWQRDAEGMIAGVTATVARVRDVASAEAAIAELQGEATKALAWAILADRASDLATLHAYGERGAVHVQLMLDAVRALLSPPGGTA